MNYLITYTAYSRSGKILSEGKVRAKNKANELDAKIKFHIHLELKYPDLGKLIIHKIEIDDPIFGLFGDIFK